MATIPSGQKFHTLASTVDTKERGSASANAKREIYTMQDIADTVSAGITTGVTSLETLNGDLTLAAGDGISITNNGTSEITISNTQTSVIGAQYDVIVRETSASAAGEVEGQVVRILSTPTDAGKLYVLNGTSWVLADADAENTTKGLLGIALGTSSVNDGMLISGIGVMAASPGGSTADGYTLYVSNTEGQVTHAAPTTGFVRIAGYFAGSNKIIFNPSATYSPA